MGVWVCVFKHYFKVTRVEKMSGNRKYCLTIFIKTSVVFLGTRSLRPQTYFSFFLNHIIEKQC